MAPGVTVLSTGADRGCVAIVAGLLLVTVLAAPSHGVIGGSQQYYLDFTKPKQARSMARWSHADKLTLNEEGLGWDGNEKASYITWIESTDPIAVGWSWRTVYSVGISATVLPAGEFKFGERFAVYPYGQFYVRHSPDAEHWSSWQALEMQTPVDHENPRQRYRGVLVIPGRDRLAYLGRLNEYSRMDVPWKSDEEAAVEWIIRKTPNFFDGNRPFIGYVQVLFETQIRGGQRLKGLKVDLHYDTSGKQWPPRDSTINKAERHRIPWRYRAP